jgi:hypothetical protein
MNANKRNWDKNIAMCRILNSHDIPQENKNKNNKGEIVSTTNLAKIVCFFP